MESADLLSMIDSDLGGEQRSVRTTITVELAQALLDRYTPARRPLREQAVARTVYFIEHPDPEGHLFEEVSVGPDGKTVAGQHLLHAIVRVGAPLEDVRLILNRETSIG